jgi:hypothetical protein
MYSPKQANATDEYVHGYVKANGTKVKGHYRSGKQFMQNKWIGIPHSQRLRDPLFHDYNDWRIAQGMTSLIK